MTPFKKESLKIAFFGGLRADWDKLNFTEDDLDVIIFTGMLHTSYYEAIRSYGDFLSWMRKYPCTFKIFCATAYDSLFSAHISPADRVKLEDLSKEFMRASNEGCYYLVSEDIIKLTTSAGTVKIGNMPVVGKTNTNSRLWPHAFGETFPEKFYDKVPKDLDILITSVPPLRKELYTTAYFGDSGILKIIETKKPKIVSYYGMSELTEIFTLQNTVCIGSSIGSYGFNMPSNPVKVIEYFPQTAEVATYVTA